MFPANNLCIAGTGSGDGKTTITLALLAALKQRGHAVQAFKAGPDFIDPSYHQQASENPSINLDTWMLGEAGMQESFLRYAKPKGYNVIEGVMGLFDGAQPGELTGSTADIVRILKIPTILVVNAKGMAGSLAPLVKGFSEFHPEVKIRGVIANQVGSTKHALLLEEVLKGAGLPPLIGYLRRDPYWHLPERHLGLASSQEVGLSQSWFQALGEEFSRNCHWDLLEETTRGQLPPPPVFPKPSKQFTLALAKDQAFHFYYQENLDLLKEKGFEIVEFSPLKDEKIPPADLYYFGGGFPESFAAPLSANHSMLQSIREAHIAQTPIYAECGGYVYLTQGIEISNQFYPMAGILPLKSKMESFRQELGYRKVKTKTASFFGPKGTSFKGHVFHWSSIEEDSQRHFWEVQSIRGPKMPSGFHHKRLVASYFHAHFKSNPKALANLVECLNQRRNSPFPAEGFTQNNIKMEHSNLD